MLARLKSKKGESLIETLVAVLVFTFASIILLSMIAAAARINNIAQREDELIASELYVAEGQDTEGEEGSITITYNEESSSVPVLTYSSGENALYSFAAK